MNSTIPVPVTTPSSPTPAVVPTPAPVAKIPARLKERYGVTYCQACGFAIDYCCCAERSADQSSADGDESGLVTRIRQARVSQGGR